MLLASLLHCCGFIRQTPKFFHVVTPQIASRRQLESFHAKDYLDLLEFYQSDANANVNVDVNAVQKGNKPQLTVPVRVPISVPSAYINLLDAYGLTDDCPIPINPTRSCTIMDILSCYSRCINPSCSFTVEHK